MTNEKISSAARNPYDLPRPRHGLAGFFLGASLLPRALRFILQRPRLWLWMLLPVTINGILFALAVVFGGGAIAAWLRDWVGANDNPGWIVQTVAIVVQVLFWVVVMLVVYVTFTPVALVIAAPFNDLVAEHTEQACGYPFEDRRGLMGQIAGETMFAVVSALKRLPFFVGVFVLLFPLNFVPVAGSLIYGVSVAVWSAFCAAFEFSSYAADRRHHGLRRRLGVISENRGMFFGFGAVAAALMLVPFVNVLAMAVGAVAGTMLFGLLGDRESAV